MGESQFDLFFDLFGNRFHVNLLSEFDILDSVHLLPSSEQQSVPKLPSEFHISIQLVCPLAMQCSPSVNSSLIFGPAFPFS